MLTHPVVHGGRVVAVQVLRVVVCAGVQVVQDDKAARLGVARHPLERAVGVGQVVQDGDAKDTIHLFIESIKTFWWFSVYRKRANSPRHCGTMLSISPSDKVESWRVH